MGAITVSNVHLEPTGNSRIHFDGSNVSIYQKDGTAVFTANTIMFTVANSTANAMAYHSPSGFALGSYIVSANDATPYGYVNAGSVVTTSSNLYSLFSSNKPEPGIKWITRTHSGPSKNLNAVAYGQGKFVAVGSNTLILKSTDGKTWSNSTAGTGTVNLTGIAYSTTDAIWSAAGSNSTFGVGLYSTDGVTWAVNNTNPGVNYSEIVTGPVDIYSSGIAVYSNSNHYIYTSGISGSLWYISKQMTFRSGSMVFGNNLFVVVGQAVNTATGFSVSTDAISWANVTLYANSTVSSDQFTSISYGNGIFITGGTGANAFYSGYFNGHPLDTPATPTTVATTTGGTLAAASYYFRVVAKNSNGYNSIYSAQSAVRTTTGSTSKITVSWANSVGATNYDLYYTTVSATDLASTRLIGNIAANTYILTAPVASITALTGYTDNTYINFTKYDTGVYTNVMNNVSYSTNGYFYALANSSYSNTSLLIKTTNGSSWTVVGRGLPGGQELAENCKSLAFGNGVWVAVGNSASGDVIRSTLAPDEAYIPTLPKSLIGITNSTAAVNQLYSAASYANSTINPGGERSPDGMPADGTSSVANATYKYVYVRELS